MLGTVKIATSLTCGCCGTWFQTWAGYIDQDQDGGYGICESCQGDQKVRVDNEYDKMWELLLEAVKPETKEKMLDRFKKDPNHKIVMVNWAMAEGKFSYSIGKR